MQTETKRKLVAVTGATGGLGKLLCHELAENYDLLLLDRNENKSLALMDEIFKAHPYCRIRRLRCDLSDIDSVKSAVNALIGEHIDALFLNAGVYNVPLTVLNTGYNNVFTVNFVSQYYLLRKLTEAGTVDKVVLTSSIAHRYGKADFSDVDYSTRKKSSLIYGNSKRFLTFAAYEYFGAQTAAKLSVAHPGVTLTNMTNHYPKLINPIVKIGIKLLFPPPKKAVKSLVSAVEDVCVKNEWIGPHIFDVWGKPEKSVLKSCSIDESKAIGAAADDIYKKL
ncbi:MAG: SDR family NAD(P)-dependent oxidoreductase [Clostridia bacterium]|nr:SDR family NAD(P)-dependent oxidoreductase [Clostridia bacterium]